MSEYYPIIGIAGKAGSGKTTTANYIAKTYNGVVVSLADPIKSLLSSLGAKVDDLWGESSRRDTLLDLSHWDFHTLRDVAEQYSLNLGMPKESNDLWILFLKYSKTPTTLRAALQEIGTSWGRGGEYPNRWIDYGIKRAKMELSEQNKNLIVIGDLRFRNEILALKGLGCPIIKIEREDTNPPSTHVSETELDTVPDGWYDYTIVNNSTQDMLYIVLDGIVRDIQKTQSRHCVVAGHGRY